MKPIMWDLFCKAGGATKGYQRAGFYVVGVDIEPQPNYCGDEFFQLDALKFAELVEEGIPDIVEPPAAEMLEMAQTLQAHTKVDFKSSNLLNNGQRQFNYVETIESAAGAKGNLTVPQTFTLGVAPFEGIAEAYKIVVRLQFRLREGEVSFRYLLDRPHDVLRSAFDDIVGTVEESLTTLAYRGTPPA